MEISKEFNKKNIEDIYGLTPTQEGILFHYLKDPHVDIYFEQISLDIEGIIDKKFFEQTWNYVIQSNEALRSVFRWEKVESPLQVVLKEHKLKLNYIDLSNHERDDRFKRRQLEKIKMNDRVKEFDLQTVPFRINLCQFAKNENVMIISWHHILYDGWSTGIILNEFFNYYHVLSTGKVLYSKTKNRFKDYVQWLEKQNFTNDQLFWKSYLNGFINYSDISQNSHQRNKGKKQYGQEAGFYSFTLQRQLTGQFDQYLRKNNITWAMALYCAWGLLLSRYTNSDDILFGTTVSGRSSVIKDIEEIVGLFINTIPLRLLIPVGLKVSEFLSNVAEIVSQRKKFEQTPLVKIKEFSGLINGEMDFNSIVVIENYPIDSKLKHSSEDECLCVKSYTFYERTHYDLSINVIMGKDIIITFIYDPETFDYKYIERLSFHFYSILNFFGDVKNLRKKVDDIEILSEEEKEKLIFRFNDTCGDFPSGKNIFTLFSEKVIQKPDEIVCIGVDIKNIGNESPVDREIVKKDLSLSNQELANRCDQLSLRLQQSGCNIGSIVGIMIEHSVEMLMGLLGILKTGAAYLPVDPSLPLNRINYMLSDSGAKVLITTSYLNKEMKIQENLQSFTHFKTIFINDIQNSVSPSHSLTFSSTNSSNLAYVIYTSGTTGNPKGVTVEHRNVVNFIYGMIQKIDLISGERILALTSISFDIFVLETWLALAEGLQMIIASPSQQMNVESLAREISREQIDHVQMTPSRLKLLYNVDESLTCLRGVKNLIIGGEAFPLNLLNELRKKFPGKIYNVYGPTETTVWSTVKDLTEPESLSIGRPILNTQVYIVSQYNCLQAVLVPGELLIGGEGVVRGYLNKPELTAERFCLRRVRTFLKKAPGRGAQMGLQQISERFELNATFQKNCLTQPGLSGRGCQPPDTSKNFLYNKKLLWGVQGGSPAAQGGYNVGSNALIQFINKGKHSFAIGRPCHGQKSPPDRQRQRLYRTGDLARWLSDGNIDFLGRLDYQVKVRGYRIELQEIEAHLLQNEKITNAVVVIFEESGQENLAAYIVSDKFINVNDLRRYLSERLPLYMIPSFFIKIDQIPLTANGKINRKALPAPEIEEDDLLIAPGSEIERQLVDIWSKVLGIEPDKLSIDGNFFALGGHSLKATMLVSQIQRFLDIDIPLTEIFNKPTIRQLSAYIAELSIGQAAEKIVSNIHSYEQREYYALSYAQRRLWVLCQFEEDSTAYNMPAAVVLGGILEEESFSRSIEMMTHRHESLHTVFILIKGEPHQKVIDIAECPKQLEVIDFRDQAVDVCEAKTREIFTKTANRAFDLENGPLFIFQLVHWSNEKSVLIYNIHHIISDGWSLGNINYEIMTLYNSFLEEGGNPLPPLELQYKDYTKWHNRLIKGGYFNHIQSYWLEKFKDKPNGMELPLDHPRRAIQTFNGERLTFFIDEDKTNQLHQLGQTVDGTLFMSLLTLLNILFYRYCGQKDIIIGAPVANRSHSKLYSMMGFLVNTLVYRNQLEPDQSSIEILKAIKIDTLSCYENQDFPFDLLVEQLELERDLSQSPLFNVMLAHNNAEPWERPLSMKGLNISPYPHIDDFNMSKFDLIFFMDEYEGQIQVRLEYNSDLFNSSTIQRMRRNFLRLLDDVLSRSEEPVWKLNLLCEEEYQQIIETFNSTGEEFRFKGLQELFEAQVGQRNDGVAVVSMEEVNWDINRGSSQLTYGELNASINRFAHYLRLECRIKPNDVLAVSMERSIDMVIVLWGIIKSGGAYLALDPTYPRDRVLHVLGDSGSDILIIDQMRPELFENYQGEILHIHEKREEWNSYSNQDPESLNRPFDVLYVNYTSGSTGTPNGAMLSHDCLTNLINWQKEKSSIDCTMSCLQFTSINFCVSFQEIMGVLSGGGRVHLIGDLVRQDIDYLMNFLSIFQIELLFLPFSYLNFLFNESHRWHESFCHNLKHIITAGEQLKVTVGLKRFLEMNPAIQLHNHYGSTEMHVVTSYTLDGSNAAKTPIPPAGFPISNVKIYILDEYLQPTPMGVWGELYVQGSSEILGYINNDSLTREKLVFHEELSRGKERLYRSGDVGRWHEDGSIELRGRKDFMVKVRGFRIELGEVESKILSFDGVRECVVVVRENNLGEKSLFAYISVTNLSVEEIERNLNRDLPHYMIPQFIVLDGLPLMPNGKVDRDKLPDPVMNLDEAVVLPRNDIERQLVRIWQEVLFRDISSGSLEIGIDNNFFDLGGHSLKATVVISRIHRELNVKIPLADFFKMPTIRSLSEYIRRAKSEQYRLINPVEKREYYSLSSAQKRIYILQQMDREIIAYNMPYFFSIPGEMIKGQLEVTIRELINRHEGFRTSFHMINEKPVQRVHDEVDFEIAVRRVEGEGSIQNILREFTRTFDLSKAPLLRIEMVRSGTSHILFLDMHHIITDGTSQDILKKEFAQLYGKEVLNALKLQYKDFSSWQNHQDQLGLLKSQEAFWLDLFTNEIPVLNIPTDYPRPIIQEFDGGGVSFLLDEGETKVLKDFANQGNATLYMSLLTVFTIFLSKLSGQQDIIVGTPIAARRHADLESIVGMFVNTLALRNYPIAGKFLLQYLSDVKSQTLLAYENQEYQFEDLVEKVSIRRDISRNPIFDVMLNLLNQGENNVDFQANLKINKKKYPYKHEINKNKDTDFVMEKAGEKEFYYPEPSKHSEGTSKFDMNMTAIEQGSCLLLHLEYSTRLFKPLTIDRYIKYFRQILKVLSSNFNIRISEIDILSEPEKEEILSFCNGYYEKDISDLTLHGLFQDQVQRSRYNIALVLNELQVTYGELNQRASVLAGVLKDQGVGFDCIVGLMLERSIEMILAILGILKAGGAYLPIDSELPKERIKYMLSDSGAVALITTSDLNREINIQKGLQPDNNLKTVFIDGLQFPDSLPHFLTFSPSHFLAPSHFLTSSLSHFINLAYVIYTSGTTGRPKGVMINHGNVVNLFKYQYKYTNIDNSRILQFATLSFDASFHEIFSALLYGGTLYLINKERRSNIEELFHYIEINEIKTVFFPMSFLRLLFGDEEYIFMIPNCVDHIQTAGEQVVVNENCRNFLKDREVFLHNHYGPSETHVVTTFTLNPQEEIPKLPSIGKPILNTSIFILDVGKNMLPVGISGELYIGGIQVGRGYLNNPELTAEKFDHDFLDFYDYPDEKKTKGKRKAYPYNTQKIECRGEPWWLSQKVRIGSKVEYCKTQESVLKRILKKSRGKSPCLPFILRQPPCVRPNRAHALRPRKQRLYKTGDLSRWLADGNIEFLGRVDLQVKIRGFRVELGEIEFHLLNYPDIKDGIVVAKKDINGDLNLYAYIVSDREIGQLLLRNYMRDKLPEYMIPNYFISIKEIKITPNGKIDTRNLPPPEQYNLHRDSYIGPGSVNEIKIAEIWGDILNLEKISLHSNFFDIGGNSLKIILVKDRLKKVFGQDLKITQLFKNTTIHTLAQLISQQEKPTQLLSKKRVDKFKKALDIREKQHQMRLSKKRRKYSKNYTE